MKPALFPVRLFLLGVSLLFTGCGSPHLPWSRRSDGLIDFVLGGERAELPVRVETSSDGGGSIVSVHVRSSGTGAIVFGRVERQPYLNPPPESHVDVMVLGAQGNMVECIAVEYLPRTIPESQHTCLPHSRYIASLASKPPPGSLVKIVFHGEPKSRCALASPP